MINNQTINIMHTLKISSDLSELNKVRAFLKQNLEKMSLTEEAYYIIELSLLEVCINIIRYAYPEIEGDIILKAWKSRGRIYLEITDFGVPFDPRSAKEPDIEEMMQTGQKGGLGVFLTKKLMDGFSYKRKNGKNILTIYKNLG